MKYFFADKDWQSDNDDDAVAAGLPGGIPVTKLYDFNLAGGGPLMRDRLWVNGSYRNWRTDKLTLARNPDGSRAIDDNWIWNISGKAIWQINPDHKVTYAYNYNWKERFHRRDTPPNFAEDRASLWQTNPAFSTQGEVHARPQPRRLRVDVRDHGRRHQLLLPAGSRPRRHPPRRQLDEHRVGRGAAARRVAELPHADRQRVLAGQKHRNGRPRPEGRRAVRADGNGSEVLGQRRHLLRVRERSPDPGQVVQHADGARQQDPRDRVLRAG